MNLENENVVEWVDYLISYAIAHKVSDIHIEPFSNYARVRMRKNGDLFLFQELSFHFVEQIVLRLQTLAHIDTTHKRFPHDGKFIVSFQDRSIDIRVSSFPVTYGQKIVLRILDSAVHAILLEQLGFSQEHLQQFLRFLEKKTGFIIVTGPTGSGKTTTLYAALRYLNSIDKNIITLEDPVEYSLQGIAQSSIAYDIGFTFDKGIRALLRQDPDIIMIGEIRDTQTAKAAIEAALTGHFVIGTMHTIDAPSAVIRLMDMGIEPYLLRSTLLGIVGQRLIKMLCICAKSVLLTSDQKEFLKQLDCQLIGAPVGCEKCDLTGYIKRVGIFEMLACSDNVKNYIADDIALDVFKKVAFEHGWRSLLCDAYDKLQNKVIDYSGYISILQTIIE